MKLYKTKKGFVIQKDDSYYLVNDESWDAFVNDDGLYSKMQTITQTNAPTEEAKKLIDESGLKVQSAILLSEAAELVKKAVA